MGAARCVPKAVEKPTRVAQTAKMQYQWVRCAFRAIPVVADTGGSGSDRDLRPNAASTAPMATPARKPPGTASPDDGTGTAKGLLRMPATAVDGEMMGGSPTAKVRAIVRQGLREMRWHPEQF